MQKWLVQVCFWRNTDTKLAWMNEVYWNPHNRHLTIQHTGRVVWQETCSGAKAAPSTKCVILPARCLNTFCLTGGALLSVKVSFQADPPRSTSPKLRRNWFAAPGFWVIYLQIIQIRSRYGHMLSALSSVVPSQRLYHMLLRGWTGCRLTVDTFILLQKYRLELSLLSAICYFYYQPSFHSSLIYCHSQIFIFSSSFGVVPLPF